MLVGSVTVTTNSPAIMVAVECMRIRSASPSVVPNNVADFASLPQNTSNVVAVPGADGFGVTRGTGSSAVAVLIMRASGTTDAAGAPYAAAATTATVRDAAAMTALTRCIDSPRNRFAASRRSRCRQRSHPTRFEREIPHCADVVFPPGRLRQTPAERALALL